LLILIFSKTILLKNYTFALFLKLQKTIFLTK